jgi:iron complex transport system ATP-binding protein
MRLEFGLAAYRYPGARRDSLRRATFEAGPGEAVAVIGPNGAGKSTLLKLALGMIEPREGSVSYRLESRAVSAPRAPRGSIAFLPQAERLGFNVSCLEYALFGRSARLGPFSSPSAADEDAARAALAEVGLPGFEARALAELSGGELQLARIARCLAQRAGVCLLDEPSTMLDPAHSASIARALSRLAATGALLMFSTHDLALASLVATRALLIADAAISFDGDPGAALEPERLAAAYRAEFRTASVPSAYPASLR